MAEYSTTFPATFPATKFCQTRTSLSDMVSADRHRLKAEADGELEELEALKRQHQQLKDEVADLRLHLQQVAPQQAKRAVCLIMSCSLAQMTCLSSLSFRASNNNYLTRIRLTWHRATSSSRKARADPDGGARGTRGENETKRSTIAF